MNDTNEEAAQVLLEDVHDAVGDLVELLQTFKNRSKLSQVLMSSLFKRREEEAEAVLDGCIARLQVREGHGHYVVNVLNEAWQGYS